MFFLRLNGLVSSTEFQGFSTQRSSIASLIMILDRGTISPQFADVFKILSHSIK